VATAPIHAAAICSLTALPDGTIASASEDGNAKLIEVPSLAIRKVLPHPGFVRSVAALKDGSLATGADDGLVRIWRR
jgi:WD40 repeat protein